MKIEHECDKCYLKDLCKNYLYRKSFMEEYKPDYYDYEFLTLRLSCTHLHKGKIFFSQCDCDRCANKPVCCLGSLQSEFDTGKGRVEFLKRGASTYVDKHFGDAFIGTICCKGYVPEENNIKDPLLR